MAGKGVTNDALCASVELISKGRDTQRDTEEVNRVASPCQPPEIISIWYNIVSSVGLTRRKIAPIAPK